MWLAATAVLRITRGFAIVRYMLATYTTHQNFFADVLWDRKKYKGELWKNALLRLLGGSLGSGRGSTTSGPRCNWGIGGGYGGPGP